LEDFPFPVIASPNSARLRSLSRSSKKFLNTLPHAAVFMSEVGQLVAGEAILSEAAALVHEHDDRCEESISSARIHEQALENLVRAHARLIYRIAYAALRSHHDAEDATQETFLRVLRYGKRLNSVDDPKTWLARIVWRVAVDRSKHRGRRQEVALDDPDKLAGEVPATTVPADEAMQGAQLGGALEKLIAALPSKLREPLILSTIDEMSPREVAATLGINEAAVRSRVFRARQILREKLNQQTSRK
jgi:RNA polymerase sigma-70 factor, ECF subfamily